MRTVKSILFAVVIIIASFYTAKAQQKKLLTLSDSSIEKLLINRNFVFTTQYLDEMISGKPIFDNYNLSISNNKILGELPTFTCSSYGSVDPYLHLNFANYHYKAIVINNIGWRVSINPTNDSYIKSMILNIGKNGYANLTIVNNKSKKTMYRGLIAQNTNDN